MPPTLRHNLSRLVGNRLPKHTGERFAAKKFVPTFREAFLLQTRILSLN